MRHTTHDTHKFWDPKNMFPTKPTWLIAFAGELGDVVSRVLPHGIFDTWERTQVRDFPQKSGLVRAWTFLYRSGSVGGAQLNPRKM